MMTSFTTLQPELPDDEVEAALARHGIKRVATTAFLYGTYRYSKLQDAVAEAKRHPASRSGTGDHA